MLSHQGHTCPGTETLVAAGVCSTLCYGAAVTPVPLGENQASPAAIIQDSVLQAMEIAAPFLGPHLERALR